MSRSSQQRRKERLKRQSDDPKWVAIRNLLALYGLRVSYDREMRSPRVVGGEPVNERAGGYRIHRGPPGRTVHVGSIFEDAPIEDWIGRCVVIDRGEYPDLYPALMFRGTHTRMAGRAAHLYAAYGGKAKWLSPQQLVAESLKIQKRYRHAHPKVLGIDFETAEARIHGATWVRDELTQVDQAAEPVEPAPSPARRGWRGYVAPTDAREPLRQRQANRPPRKIS